MSCEYDGKSYQDGASFPSSDGCNSCACDAGEVVCTARACFIGCLHGGKTYQPGQQFPADDGCNTCSCAEGGQVSCTEKGCPSCRDWSEQYGALVREAGACDPAAPDSCSLRVAEGLSCGCDTFVNPQAWDAAAARASQQAYRDAECGQDIVCGPCAVIASAYCSAEGRCVAYTDPTDGVACRVNAKVYPNGASGIQDPTSCNLCVCDQGQLSCDDADCPKPCPDGTQRSTGCAQCGPTDACEVVETGCFPTCTSTCQEGFCSSGVCKRVCG